MKRKHTKQPPDCMEYPFGFGFALMDNPRAMSFFFSLDDNRKRELMRSIVEIQSQEEMRGFLAGIAEQIPSYLPKETP